MEHHSPATDRPLRVPTIVWIIGLGLIVALVAIFVFNVSLGTVGYYALFAFFIGSHFFIHGSHGGHGGHAQRTGSSANVDGPAQSAQANQDEQGQHSGSCH